MFDPDQAAAMTDAGADVLVPHVGLTTSGSIGARTALTLDDVVAAVQRMRDAAAAVNPDVLVLCHGGPIAGQAAASRASAPAEHPDRVCPRRAPTAL